jgi:hypothetical protein
MKGPKLLLPALLSLFVLMAHAQQANPATSSLSAIRAYTRSIDSLENEVHEGRGRDPKMGEGISEGPMTTTITTIVYNKKTGQRDTSVTKKNMGGFGLYTLFAKDTVFKIRYHDTYDQNMYETYYFKDNQLVCSKVRLEKDGIGEVICQGEEYYRDGKVIYKILSPHKVRKTYSERLSFSWWDKGNEYLRKYYNP